MNTIKSVVKVDDNNIAVTKITQELPPVIYSYDYLISQKEVIQQSWDSQLADLNTSKQAKMDEIDALIAEADKLSVVKKPIETKIAG